jgi:RHS repeat-associated protein
MTNPWGKIVPGYSFADSVPNRYGLTGQEKDAETASTANPTGEMHYRARAYSPRQIRFLQNDPPVSQRGEHHYVFVVNAPVSSRDPKGERVWGFEELGMLDQRSDRSGMNGKDVQDTYNYFLELEKQGWKESQYWKDVLDRQRQWLIANRPGGQSMLEAVAEGLEVGKRNTNEAPVKVLEGIAEGVETQWRELKWDLAQEDYGKASLRVSYLIVIAPFEGAARAGWSYGTHLREGTFAAIEGDVKAADAASHGLATSSQQLAIIVVAVKVAKGAAGARIPTPGVKTLAVNLGGVRVLIPVVVVTGSRVVGQQAAAGAIGGAAGLAVFMADTPAPNPGDKGGRKLSPKEQELLDKMVEQYKDLRDRIPDLVGEEQDAALSDLAALERSIKHLGGDDALPK